MNIGPPGLFGEVLMDSLEQAPARVLLRRSRHVEFPRSSRLIRQLGHDREKHIESFSLGECAEKTHAKGGSPWWPDCGAVRQTVMNDLQLTFRIARRQAIQPNRLRNTDDFVKAPSSAPPHQESSLRRYESRLGVIVQGSNARTADPFAQQSGQLPITSSPTVDDIETVDSIQTRQVRQLPFKATNVKSAVILETDRLD